MQIISQNPQAIWLEFGLLLRLVGLIYFILTLSWLIIVQGRRLYIGDSVKKKKKKKKNRWGGGGGGGGENSSLACI